jgi:putative ABC transport system permease protein
MHFSRDFQYALRLLRRTPGFTAVALAVLALGIGVNTAVFSVVNALVLQPRPGRIDQGVGVFSRDRAKPDHYRDFSYPAFVDLRDRSNVFERLLAHTFSVVGIGEREAVKQTFVSIVSSGYFETLGVPPVAGRAFSRDEERPGARATVAIASYAIWRNTGFSPTFVGSQVHVNGTPFTVVGVVPRGFAGTMSLLSPQWWFPLGSYDVIVNDVFRQRATGLTDRGNYAVNLAGILKPGIGRVAAERALDAFARRLDAEYVGTDHDQTFVLAELPRLGVSSQPEGAKNAGLASFSALLMLMAGLVLAVACLNLANLLLARGAARRKEIAVRQALGSGRLRIIQQLLVEGLTLATIGAAFGLMIGWWSSGALAAWLGRILPLGVEVLVEPSWRLGVAAAALAIFSTIFFALGPAWALSRPMLTSDLKETQARSKQRTSTVLVVGQLALSLALVAAGGLFVRAAINAAGADPGFSLDRQLIVSIDPSLAGYDQTRSRNIVRAALDRVRSTPGVQKASLASVVPFGEFEEGRSARLLKGDDPVGGEFLIVGAEYFETIGLPLLRGREFTRAEEDPLGTHPGVSPLIIDRRLAEKLFKEADPLGRQVLIQPRESEPSLPYEVVGIAGEMRHDIFESSPRPHMYVPFGPAFRSMMTIHIRTQPGAADAAMLSAIQAELRRVDAGLPITAAKTMVQHRDRSITEWAVRAAATLFTTFGALALLLATIGVYGLKAYDVSRRMREIGIRMALGATAANVRQLVLREGMRTTMIGLAIGTLMAAGVGKLVSGLLYRVSPFDPIVLTIAVVVLSTASLLACYLPARRATRVVLLEALRSE